MTSTPRGHGDRPGEIRLVALDTLTGEDISAWNALRASNPALDSPYFHPGFAAAVHSTGRTVSVVVVRDAAGAISALLPGHREGARLRPAGWPGADFQGPVLAPDTVIPPGEFLADGLREYEFDHVIAPGRSFDPWILCARPSPYLVTTGGLDGYLTRASRSGRDNMGQARRRVAKAERMYGPIRFAADSIDGLALSRVIELKRAQYAATGARDYFRAEDRITLLHSLLHTREASFAGILSTLHFGDHLVAAHFGIRSDHVLHWWFPVYDPTYAQLAPGWMLLRELVKATPGLGIHRIDLGRGDDEYKRRAKTGETLVSQGVLTRSAVRRTLHRARYSAINAARSSTLAPTLRQAAQTTKTALAKRNVF